MNSSLNKKKQSAIPLGRLWFHHDYQFGRLHLQLLMMWCGCLYLNLFLAAWSKQLLCFPFQDHCELLMVNCSAQQLTGNTAVQLKPCYWLKPKGILSFLKKPSKPPRMIIFVWLDYGWTTQLNLSFLKIFNYSKTIQRLALSFRNPHLFHSNATKT